MGYEPHFIQINWKYRILDDWVEQVSAKIPKSELQKSLLSGFSFGSMIAIGVAAITNPEKLLLFSLSPYFEEDRPFPAKYQKWHGKRRIANFKKLSFNQLASQIKCPTWIFVGNKEIEKYPDTTGRRVKTAHRIIADSKLVKIDDVGHDVGDPAYVKAIKKALS